MKTLRFLALIVALAGFTLAGVAQFTTNAPEVITPSGSSFTTNAPGVKTNGVVTFTTSAPSRILSANTTPPGLTNVYLTNGVFILQGVSWTWDSTYSSRSVDIWAKYNGGSYAQYETIMLSANLTNMALVTTTLQTNTSLTKSNFEFKLRMIDSSGIASFFTEPVSPQLPAPTVTEDTNTFVGTIRVTSTDPNWFTNGCKLEVWTNTAMVTSLVLTNRPINGIVSSNNFAMTYGKTYQVRLRNGSVVTPLSGSITPMGLAPSFELIQNAHNDWTAVATWAPNVTATALIEYNADNGGWNTLSTSGSPVSSGYSDSFDPAGIADSGASVLFRVTLTDAPRPDASSTFGPFTTP